MGDSYYIKCEPGCSLDAEKPSKSGVKEELWDEEQDINESPFTEPLVSISNIADDPAASSCEVQWKELEEDEIHKKLVSCDKCGRTSIEDLEKHRSTCPEERPHVCTVCKKTFNSLEHLNFHMYIHDRIRPHKCDTCEKGFTTKWKLDNHTLIHTGKRPYPCQICGKAFSRRDNLQKHVITHTRNKVLISDPTVEAPSKSESFPCGTCNKKFRTLERLDKHTLVHVTPRTYSYGTYDLVCSRTEQSKHALEHVKKVIFTCTICAKVFPSLEELENHTSGHRKAKSHDSSICGKSISSSSHRTCHILEHTVDRPFVCDKCKKAFASKGTLRAHMKTSLRKKPQCKICERTFTCPAHLFQHMLIHSNARKHFCPSCRKSFVQLPDLKAHMAVHVWKSDVVPEETNQ